MAGAVWHPRAASAMTHVPAKGETLQARTDQPGHSKPTTRVIVPTTRLRPATARLLNRHAPGHTRVPLGPAADAYCTLMERLWAQGEGFAIVEHDIGIHPGVLPQFEACPSWWCGFQYDIGRPPNHITIAALGCTRFRTELLRAEPDLMEMVGKDGSGGVPARVWQRLDVRMLDHLRLRGYTRCDHTPTVKHYHQYV